MPRSAALRVYGQGVTTTAAFTFTFEDWNLFDDDAGWREATIGTVEERKQQARRSRHAGARLRGYRLGRSSTVPIPDIVVLECATPRDEAASRT